MNIGLETIDDLTIVSPVGRINALSAEKLQETVDELLRRGATRIVVHLADVSYISSAGLRVFLKVAKKLHPRGRLAVSGLNDHVRQVFQMAGFANIMTLCDDLDSAMEKAKS